MATILFLNRLDDRWMESIRRLKREFSHVEMITYKEAESPRDLLPQADAIVTGYLSREEVRKASRLKAIFVPFAGVNMLPIEDIRQRSIIVSNAHGNAKYVAERALALALALLGRVVEYHEDLERGIWRGDLTSCVRNRGRSHASQHGRNSGKYQIMVDHRRTP